MYDRDAELRELATANVHVRQAVARVAEQAARVRNMKTMNVDASLAEAILLNMQQSLEAMESHRQFIEQRLRGSD